MTDEGRAHGWFVLVVGLVCVAVPGPYEYVEECAYRRYRRYRGYSPVLYIDTGKVVYSGRPPTRTCVEPRWKSAVGLNALRAVGGR